MQLPVKPVGALPPVVYWRRRALVLAPLLALLLTFASCVVTANGSPEESVAHSGSRTPSKKKAKAVFQDGSKEHPFIPSPGSSGAPTSSPSPSSKPAKGSPAPPALMPPPLPAPAGPIPCADGDLKVEVGPEQTNYPLGSRLKVKLILRNISGRSCTRDVGAGQQEITAQSGAQRVWSSDHCSMDRSADVRTLAVGETRAYWVVWTGHASAEGCPGSQPLVAAGSYQLVARVGTITSQPATVNLK